MVELNKKNSSTSHLSLELVRSGNPLSCLDGVGENRGDVSTRIAAKHRHGCQGARVANQTACWTRQVKVKSSPPDILPILQLLKLEN